MDYYLMNREQEIIERMLKLANEYNTLECDGSCKGNNCWSQKKLCNSVTNFIYQAKERLGLGHDEIPTF